MIAPVRWLLGRVSACATRAETRAKGCACQWEAGDSPCLTCAEERIDDMAREETRLRGELRDAVIRAQKAEGKAEELQRCLNLADPGGVGEKARGALREREAACLGADQARMAAIARAEKAEAQIDRWRALVEAARRFVVAWRDEGSSEAVEAQRWIIHAVERLDAEQEGGGS